MFFQSTDDHNGRHTQRFDWLRFIGSVVGHMCIFMSLYVVLQNADFFLMDKTSQL